MIKALVKSLLAGGVMLLLFTSCYSTPFVYEDREILDKKQPLKVYKLAPWKKISLQARLVIEFPFYSASLICMMQAKDSDMTIAAMLPAGVKFMEISGRSGKAEKWYFLPGFTNDRNKQREIAGLLLEDFKRIFMDERFLYPGKLPGTELRRSSRGVELSFGEKGEKRFYGSKKMRLMKKSVKNKDCCWQSEYFRCNVKGDFVYPESIVYENISENYRLILRVFEFKAE